MNHQQSEIVAQLAASGIPVFPCWDNKKPAVKEGFHAATLKPDGYWPSEYIGIPVPLYVFIIDLDLYKGITTEAIEQKLDCQLDWDRSLIQMTPSGGRHHAFYVTEPMHQQIDWFWREIGKGFDTRAHTKGYICTGSTYEWSDSLGLFKILDPSTLPPLPDKAIEVLKQQDNADYEPQPLPTGDRVASEIQAMIDHIDPDCSRDEWMTVLRGIRHYYHDDEPTGWALFNEWSKTALTKYDARETGYQWNDTAALPKDHNTRPVTIASVSKLAAEQYGYIPSSIAAEVFSAGDPEPTVSANRADVELLIVKINSEGGKPEKIDELTTNIRDMACSNIQRVALTAALQRTLRDHGIKITEQEIKKATSAAPSLQPIIPQPVASVIKFRDLPVAPVQALGNVHIQNAGMLIQAVFGNRMIRIGDEVSWWNGAHWESVNKADLNAAVAHAFIGNDFGKTSNIDGTHKQLKNMLQTHDQLGMPSRKIFFKNGVYDPMRPDLGIQPHHPDNLNTSALTIDYSPGTDHPEWTKFLASIFFEEPERTLLLQEIMGWMLIRDNLGHQKAVAFDGVSRSGKGTIFDVMHDILGIGMTDISLAQLIDNKSLSSLRSTNLAIDRDSKKPAARDINQVHSQFNKITANEPISIPLLFTQVPWTGRLNCKLMIACNGIPVMIDDSGAAPNRWIILKFTECFAGKEDLTLGKRIRGEVAAIAAWAVEGLRRVMHNGNFTLPQSSIEESHALVNVSSPLLQFAEDRLIIGPDKKSHGDLLWQSYKQWCKHTNNHAPNRNQFVRSLERALQDQGVRYKKSMKINGLNRTGLTGVALDECKDGLAPNVTPISQAFKNEDK